MKASMVLVLLLLLGTAVAAYSHVSIAEVSSVMSPVRATEPARLLICGATLIVLSAAVRRATLETHK